MSNPGTTVSFLLRGLKLSHLRLLAEVQTQGQLGLAAQKLGLAQPAASRLLAEMERIVGHAVHAREGRGLALTPVGAALARRAARVLLEIADAEREIPEAASGARGHVRIGSVTGPALSHVLPVLAELRKGQPGITVEVVVAMSNLLCDQLLAGRLDFALGRINSPALEQSLTITPLGDEPLSLVVRQGHPLVMHPRLTALDTLAHDWVMPEDETLLTRTVLAQLAALGLPLPRRQVLTSSFLFTLALLNDSDAVAPISAPVAASFAAGPSMPFVQLPLDLGLRVAPFGLLRRRNADPTPSAARIADRILARVAVGRMSDIRREPAARAPENVQIPSGY